MFLDNRSQPSFPFARYFHFAEPASRGVAIVHGEPPVPDDELASAAAALRAAEVEAVRTDDHTVDDLESVRSYDTVSELSPLNVLKSMKLTAADLESMSIDEVRAVANVLDIPDRGTITDKSELVQEILRRM